MCQLRQQPNNILSYQRSVWKPSLSVEKIYNIVLACNGI